MLRRIACEIFPVVLTTDADIEAVCPLVHAGWVEAKMQVVLFLQAGVVVTSVTPLGWAMLRSQAAKPVGHRHEL